MNLRMLLPLLLLIAATCNLAAQAVLDVTLLPGQIVRLAWPASTGNAVLESSPGLGVTADWQPLTQIPALANGLYIVNFQAVERYRFFRLRVTPASLATRR